MASKLCGAICLNGSVVREVCENCVWYDWDEASQTCGNRKQPICRLYLSDLFPPKPTEATYS
jgi:hypothetical protein